MTLKKLTRCFGLMTMCLAQRSVNKSHLSSLDYSGSSISGPLLGPQAEELKGRKTLVLDLDETLIHSTFEFCRKPDFVLPVKVKGVTHLLNVMKRPGLEEFLDIACELFEVVIFTASLAEYAAPVVKKIDSKNKISWILCREACTEFDKSLVKDLSRLGRNLKDIILIDNSDCSSLFQPENAYHITDFFDSKKDRELYRLIPLLEQLANVDDVRPIKAHQKDFENRHWKPKARTQTTQPIASQSEMGMKTKPNMTQKQRPKVPFRRLDSDTLPLTLETEPVETSGRCKEELPMMRRQSSTENRSLDISEPAMSNTGLCCERTEISMSGEGRQNGSFSFSENWVKGSVTEERGEEKETIATRLTSFRFTSHEKEKYVKFGCESECLEEEEGNKDAVIVLNETFGPTSPTDKHTLHNVFATEKKDVLIG